MKLEAEITIVKVPVPEEDLPFWKMAVADVYRRLERMVEEEKLMNSNMKPEEA